MSETNVSRIATVLLATLVLLGLGLGVAGQAAGSDTVESFEKSIVVTEDGAVESITWELTFADAADAEEMADELADELEDESGVADVTPEPDGEVLTIESTAVDVGAYQGMAVWGEDDTLVWEHANPASSTDLDATYVVEMPGDVDETAPDASVSGETATFEVGDDTDGLFVSAAVDDADDVGGQPGGGAPPAPGDGDEEASAIGTDETDDADEGADDEGADDEAPAGDDGTDFEAGETDDAGDDAEMLPGFGAGLAVIALLVTPTVVSRRR